MMRSHSWRTSLGAAVVFSLLLVTGVSWTPTPATVSAADKPLREWSDKSGKFKIKARFGGLEDGTVTLEKEDGSEIEIDLKKLSAADQKYAAEAAKESDENPFETKPTDPFKSKKKPAGKNTPSKGSKDKDEESTDTATRDIKVDPSQGELIALANTDGWKLELPSIDPLFPKPPKPVSLPKKTNFFEGVKGMAFNPAAKKAAVGYVIAPPGQPPQSRVLIVDLTTSKATPAAMTPGSYIVMALHDDGKQILVRKDVFGFGNSFDMEIWTLSGDKVQKKLTFAPYAAANGAAKDVSWAEFASADKLITCSREGHIVIWNYPDMTADAQFTVGQNAPALSPDRKRLAYCTGSEFGVLDLEKKEVLAQQPTEGKLQWATMAFSPSGKQLACVAFDRVVQWDAATGKQEALVVATGLHINGHIQFPADDFVLAGNQYLIDMKNQVKLWTYQGADAVACAGGITFFVASDGDRTPGAFLSGILPHPEANSVLQKALSDPDLFVIKPNTTVTVNTSSIPDQSQKANIEKQAAKALEKINCKVGPGGSVELQATVEGPTSRKVSYTRGGTYQVQEYITRAKLVYQGKTVWETSSTNVPFFVVLNGDENMESYLRKREKPDYDLFGRIEFPKYIQRPSDGAAAGNSQTIGTSKVTITGLRSQ